MRLSRRTSVKQVHLVVGVLAIALSGAVALQGAWGWWQARSSVWFWRLLRVGQAVIVVQVALGGVLVLLGHKPPGLHVIYGILPLLVSLVAEALRAARGGRGRCWCWGRGATGGLTRLAGNRPRSSEPWSRRSSAASLG